VVGSVPNKAGAGSTIHSNSLTKKNLEDLERSNKNDSKMYGGAGATNSTAVDLFELLSEDG
jgi:hypothetical protein